MEKEAAAVRQALSLPWIHWLHPFPLLLSPNHSCPHPALPLPRPFPRSHQEKILGSRTGTSTEHRTTQRLQGWGDSTLWGTQHPQNTGEPFRAQ